MTWTKCRIVTAVETTPAGIAESQALPGLLSKDIFCTHCRPEEAVADGAYGTREVYRFLDSMRILRTIPRRRTWQNLRGRRIEAGFRYESNRDVYICPQGKTLFAEMKGPRGLRRATLRSTTKVHIQVLLALAVHNIRQLVKGTGPRRRKPEQVSGLIALFVRSLWGNHLSFSPT